LLPSKTDPEHWSRRHPAPLPPKSRLITTPWKNVAKKKNMTESAAAGREELYSISTGCLVFFGGIMGFFKTNPYQYYPVDPNRNEQLRFIMNRGTYEKTVCSLTPMGTSF